MSLLARKLKESLNILRNISSLNESEDYSEIIDLMNQDISKLYRAVIQYNNHIALIKGAEWMGYVEDLKGHAADDASQALFLCEKVAYYGGIPTVSIDTPLTAEDSRAMVELDEQIQREAVETYNERVNYCKENNLIALVDFYQGLATHEEEHHNTTLSYLNLEK